MAVSQQEHFVIASGVGFTVDHGLFMNGWETVRVIRF